MDAEMTVDYNEEWARVECVTPNPVVHVVCRGGTPAQCDHSGLSEAQVWIGAAESDEKGER